MTLTTLLQLISADQELDSFEEKTRADEDVMEMLKSEIVSLSFFTIPSYSLILLSVSSWNS